jgi:hypothetical protein
METHHIQPEADRGSDTIENAIPVCFECHAEIQLYNDRHPRGRKFRPDELRLHKEQWLRICKETPHLLLAASRSQDVGPLQALVDELEFNIEIAARTDATRIGAPFLVAQLQRAIEGGVFSLLQEQVRAHIAGVYATLMKANANLATMTAMPWGERSSAWHHAFTAAQRTIEGVQAQLPLPRDALLSVLGHPADDA